jgi:hypothetical protein
MANSPWLAPLRPVGRFGETILDRVLCVLGAVGLSQAPEYFQQYLQRLGGHLDEARRQLASYEAVARQSGITLQQLIDTTRAQAAEPVAKLGGVIADTQARVESLEAAEAALREASVWERPFVFIANLDPAIAARTWEVFKPAVPVTAEGFVYAAVGMLLALGLYQCVVVLPARGLMRWWKKPAVAKG